MPSDFLNAFSNILKQNGLDINRGANYYVASWNDFITSCIEGYPYSLFDYDLDIYMRGQIDFLIKSPDLQGFSEFRIFKTKIEEIDNQLMSITMDRPNKKQLSLSWWENRILKYAGPEYVKNILDIYDLKIELVE